MGKTWKDRPQLDRPVTQDDILLLSDTTDGGIIKWIKASLFRGPGVKKIKKTASEGLTDTYTFFYDDGSKFDFIINNGDRGIPKAWMGEWNANINYPAEVGVEYEGSSYFTLKECIGIKPTNKEYYGLLAKSGKDGENGKDGSVEDCLMLRDYDPTKRREQVAFEADLEETNKNLAENYLSKDQVSDKVIASISEKIIVGGKELELKHINNVVECDNATYEALYSNGILDTEPYASMYFVVPDGKKFRMLEKQIKTFGSTTNFVFDFVEVGKIEQIKLWIEAPGIDTSSRGASIYTEITIDKPSVLFKTMVYNASYTAGTAVLDSDNNTLKVNIPTFGSSGTYTITAISYGV